MAKRLEQGNVDCGVYCLSAGSLHIPALYAPGRKEKIIISYCTGIVRLNSSFVQMPGESKPEGYYLTFTCPRVGRACLGEGGREGSTVEHGKVELEVSNCLGYHSIRPATPES